MGGAIGGAEVGTAVGGGLELEPDMKLEKKDLPFDPLSWGEGLLMLLLLVLLIFVGDWLDDRSRPKNFPLLGRSAGGC